jgi:hypothetical protein
LRYPPVIYLEAKSLAKGLLFKQEEKFMSEQTRGCPWMAYMHHLPGSGRVFKSNRDAGRRRRRRRQIHDYTVVP